MKADLHVHSDHSDDGHQTVEEILRRCDELGIGAVAITDHNAMKAPQDAARLRQYKVVVIPAMEVTAREGHVLALGIKESTPRGLTVDQTIAKIHEAGGIAIAPHAYRWWSGLGEKNVEGKEFDAIEVINGRCKAGSNGHARKLAERMNLPGVGGSDAHDPQYIGQAYTVVPDECRTAEEVVQAIKDGKCEAVGKGRSVSGSVDYGTRSISRFFLRGFKRL